MSASAPSGTTVPGASWMVRSAMVGGVDAADVPFEVSPDQSISNAVVTFTDKTGEISGTVLDAADHPTPEFSIILFSIRPLDVVAALTPAPSARAREHGGQVQVQGLLPGEYYLAALTDFEPN